MKRILFAALLFLGNYRADAQSIVIGSDGKRTLTISVDSVKFLSGVGLPSTSNLGAAPISAALEIFDDFVSATASGNRGWTATFSGTNAGVNNVAIADSNRWGMKQATTGTTNSGYGGVNLGADQLMLNGGYTSFECAIQIPTLGDGTNKFVVLAGFMDNFANAEPVDGAYFYYNNDTNTAKWVMVTRSNTSNQSRLWTTATVTANAWQKLRIEGSQNGQSITFYVNGTSVGTLNTPANIPYGSGRATSDGIKIYKTASTTARLLNIDYATVSKIFSVTR